MRRPLQHPFDPPLLRVLIDEQLEQIEFYVTSCRAFCNAADDPGFEYAFKKCCAHLREVGRLRDLLKGETS